ncbi:unnamed protein product [Gongylonema pulchrum]|uniref:Secreted protein n=1 Tax=Gongylonema pulchrum TaxID=637853 RepID=A0A183D378_9BILA|nr:unnamed protein product [Gongylonema pulchrum]
MKQQLFKNVMLLLVSTQSGATSAREYTLIDISATVRSATFTIISCHFIPMST